MSSPTGFIPYDTQAVRYVTSMPTSPDPSIVYMLWDGVDSSKAVRYEFSDGKLQGDGVVETTLANLGSAQSAGVGAERIVTDADNSEVPVATESDGQLWLEKVGLIGGKLVSALSLPIFSKVTLGRKRKPARVVYDIVVTSGSNIVTSASAYFQQSDVGAVFSITDENNYQYSICGTITSITNSTNATISVTPTFSSIAGTKYTSSASMAFGGDNSDIIAAMISSLTSTGSYKTAYIPSGLFMTTSGIVLPNGTCMESEGVDYGLSTSHSLQGFSLAANLGNNAFFTLGDDAASFLSGKNRPVVANIGFDANNLAGVSVKAVARRTRLDQILAWRGKNIAMQGSAQNMESLFGIYGQHNRNIVATIQADDIKYFGGQMRQGGNADGSGAQLYITPCADALVQGVHMWSGFNGPISASYAGHNIFYDVPAGTNSVTEGLTITGCIFDSTYGNHIKIRNNGSSRVGNIAITGNHFQQVQNFPDNAYAVIDLEVNSGSVRFLEFTGNEVVGNLPDVRAYSAFIKKSGAGAVSHIVDGGGNVINGCNTLYSGLTPSKGTVCSRAGSTVEYKSENCGKATFSGTGAQLIFTIPHGLDVAPIHAEVSAASVAAAGTFYVSSDATNITVTYTSTAPVSGTNNVVLSWSTSIN